MQELIIAALAGFFFVFFLAVASLRIGVFVFVFDMHQMHRLVFLSLSPQYDVCFPAAVEIGLRLQA